MRSIAIITARGGSKRIPRKNIKEFCGQPIIKYSIDAAISSGIFNEVMVSTDDIEIAEVARKYGAKVPFIRSEATSSDYATTNDVLLEVLAEYAIRDISFDYLCCIYPTAPFLNAAILINALSLLSEETNSVIPVVEYPYPPQRGFIKNSNSFLELKYPEYKDMRTQDLEKLYYDCGQFYFCKVNSFKQTKRLLTDKTTPLILSPEFVQDIDTEDDWKIAELKYEIMKRKNSNENS